MGYTLPSGSGTCTCLVNVRIKEGGAYWKEFDRGDRNEDCRLILESIYRGNICVVSGWWRLNDERFFRSDRLNNCLEHEVGVVG